MNRNRDSPGVGIDPPLMQTLQMGTYLLLLRQAIVRDAVVDVAAVLALRRPREELFFSMGGPVIVVERRQHEPLLRG